MFAALALSTNYYPNAIISIKLVDSASAANTYTYKLSSNLPYELPIGNELDEQIWNYTAQTPSGVDYGGVTYTYNNVSANMDQFDSIPIGVGDRLEMRFKITNYNGGVVRFLIYYAQSETLVGQYYGSGGDFVYLTDSVAQGDTITRIRLNSFEFDSEISNLSIRIVPASGITIENSEPDGSDRILVTRKEDNSGFTDGTTDYDYATGANP